MDKRIILELRGKHPSLVKELDLSFCKSGGDIEGLTEEFENLESINCEGSNITNLKNFPKLKNLRRIDLSANRLSKGFEPLSGCLNLWHINLNGNQIKKLEVFDPLKSLEKLTHLEIAAHELPTRLPIDEVRASIFAQLPSLQYLDGEDVYGNRDDEENVINGNGGDEDGDDELDGEEEEEDSDDGDSDEEGEADTDLGLLYGTTISIDEEEDDESNDGDGSEDEEDDDDEDDEEDDEEQSTRGKVSGGKVSGGKVSGGKVSRVGGKKRKFEDDPDDDSGV